MNSRILSETAVRYFLQVVNSGSISEAALRLHVVPSAISRQISRLESELGTPLIQRQSRGVALTAAGELLASYARRTQLDAEMVANEIAALNGEAETLIRLACTQGFVPQCLPDVMARFQSGGNSGSFQLHVTTAQEVTRLVREAQVDIGFSFSLGATRDINVVYNQPAPLLALVSRDHLLSSRAHISLSEIADYPLALPGPDTTLRQLFDIYCSREGLTYKIALETDHLSSLVEFVSRTIAIAFTGELAVRHRLDSGDLVALNVPELVESDRSIEIQTLAGRQLPSAMQVFIEHMKYALQSTPSMAG